MDSPAKSPPSDTQSGVHVPIPFDSLGMSHPPPPVDPSISQPVVPVPPLTQPEIPAPTAEPEIASPLHTELPAASMTPAVSSSPPPAPGVPAHQQEPEITGSHSSAPPALLLIALFFFVLTLGGGVVMVLGKNRVPNPSPYPIRELSAQENTVKKTPNVYPLATAPTATSSAHDANSFGL